MKHSIFIVSTLIAIVFFSCDKKDENDECIGDISVIGVEEAAHAKAFTVTIAGGKTIHFNEEDFEDGKLQTRIGGLRGDVKLSLFVDLEIIGDEGSYAISEDGTSILESVKRTEFYVNYTLAVNNWENYWSDESLILNHNFADGLKDWRISGDEQRVVLSSGDNGQIISYDGSSLIQIFSEKVPAEPNTRYLLGVNVKIEGYRSPGGDGANYKIRWFSDQVDNQGSYRFVGEHSELMPASETDGFIRDGVIIESPENAAYMEIEMAAWHPHFTMFVDAVIVAKIEQ